VNVYEERRRKIDEHEEPCSLLFTDKCLADYCPDSGAAGEENPNDRVCSSQFSCHYER
jgi:hypothetical protein